MLKLYNTKSRKVENFKPLGDIVKVYTCGPTVYDYAHIGNYTAYIFWDLLVRVLKFDGYKVRRVLNLTDVGHLVSDSDEGEDKLEKGARKSGKSAYEVADFFADDFMKNFRELNLVEPDVIAKATDYVADGMEMVDKMTAGGFTYETTDGVYFDTSKFPSYADFAKIDLSGLKAGARVDFSSEKKNASDFAVWKFIQPGEKHEMRWDYLGRPGYPGWHLECSTIINKELGEPIDIHTGGIDHIPIHHTNEIAQTFAINGCDLSRFWLHCNFITIDGEKVSKSLGNTYNLNDLKERGFSAMDYKMWVLSGHYRGERNFTFDGLAAAKTRRLNWRNKIALCYQREIPNNQEALARVVEALNSNLNSAEAFSVIDGADFSFSDWEKIEKLFGLGLISDSPNIDNDISALIFEREEARKARDFSRADTIRESLKLNGITIEDTPSGPVWQYAEKNS